MQINEPMKVWYSFFDSSSYSGKEPAFFSTENKKWVQELEKNTDIIRAEMQNLLSDQNEFQPYFSNDLNKNKSWKTFVLKWWGIEFFANQQKCPNTTALIQSIPGLVSASFSCLDAHSEIPAHYGDTNAIYRAHLGLVVPASLPECGFTVKGENRSWENGKMLIFCDAHHHSAFNRSEKTRIILIIDVIREEYLAQQNLISANVMASLFLQKRLHYFPFYKIAPGFFGGILHFFAKWNALWFIPFRNDLYCFLANRKKS